MVKYLSAMLNFGVNPRYYKNYEECCKPHPIVHCKVALRNDELWRKFHSLGTEMIITKCGRRMFPSLHVQVTELSPSSLYCVVLEMVPVSHNRYKYSSSGGWFPAGSEESQSPQRLYLHPDSPARGDYWMSQPVSFGRLKLTNTIAPPAGQVVLSSMHKYQPKIIIVQASDPRQIGWAPSAATFFPETEFIAVTAYQNEKITKLKIDNNPFAKGFRESGQAKCKRKIIESDYNEEENKFKKIRLDPLSPIKIEDDSFSSRSSSVSPLSSPEYSSVSKSSSDSDRSIECCCSRSKSSSDSDRTTKCCCSSSKSSSDSDISIKCSPKSKSSSDSDRSIKCSPKSDSDRSIKCSPKSKSSSDSDRSIKCSPISKSSSDSDISIKCSPKSKSSSDSDISIKCSPKSKSSSDSDRSRECCSISKSSSDSDRSIKCSPISKSSSDSDRSIKCSPISKSSSDSDRSKECSSISKSYSDRNTEDIPFSLPSAMSSPDLCRKSKCSLFSNQSTDDSTSSSSISPNSSPEIYRKYRSNKSSSDSSSCSSIFPMSSPESYSKSRSSLSSNKSSEDSLSYSSSPISSPEINHKPKPPLNPYQTFTPYEQNSSSYTYPYVYSFPYYQSPLWGSNVNPFYTQISCSPVYPQSSRCNPVIEKIEDKPRKLTDFSIRAIINR